MKTHPCSHQGYTVSDDPLVTDVLHSDAVPGTSAFIGGREHLLADGKWHPKISRAQAADAWKALHALQVDEVRPADASLKLAESRVKQLRRALMQLLRATAAHSSKGAIAAREAAHEAYRNSLSASEMNRVLATALDLQRAAPPGSWLRTICPIKTYEDAVEIFGSSLIDETLGDER